MPLTLTESFGSSEALLLTDELRTFLATTQAITAEQLEIAGEAHFLTNDGRQQFDTMIEQVVGGNIQQVGRTLRTINKLGAMVCASDGDVDGPISKMVFYREASMYEISINDPLDEVTMLYTTGVHIFLRPNRRINH